MRTMIFVALTICLAFGTTSFSRAAEVAWHTDIQTAMELAQKENKPILLHFYGDFCGPCREMDKNVFPNPSVIKELTENFVPVKIDTSKDQATTKKYGIRGIPADVFMTPQGEILHQRVGGANVQKYLQEIQNVAQIAQTKLDAVQNIASQQIQEEIKTTFAGDANFQLPVTVSPQINSPQSTHWAEAQAQQVAVPNHVAQNHAAKIGGGLPLQNQTATVAQRPAANSFLDPPLENKTLPTQQQFQEQFFAQNSNEVPSPPPTEKKLLFDGFCPVTLSLETRWVKGQEQYFTEYEGGLFYFASAEARNMFLESPYQYAPVASGNDIVEWAVNQKKVLGSRKFGAWFQGNVYLFSSRDNYDRFQANPHFFAGQALQMSRLITNQLR